MTPVEITFVVLGVVLLLVSCFIGGKEESSSESHVMSEEVMDYYKRELKNYADHLMEEKSEEVIVKTDDYLSKVSNEKIMAVTDYTDQILAKIDANHKEVVFLYDMLNQKEDDIKQMVHQFDHEKQQMAEVVEDVIKLTKQIQETSQKAAEEVKPAAKPVEHKPVELKKVTENQEDGQMEFVEMLPADRQKKEILDLYKQGMTVRDISKTLGIGQGEVQLIIGLYGA
ncbi:MAG: hypothetical protein J6J42_00985 [Lachnospiraceae bacterium]|nr:hypothetical protein [Lachnospiraceae bacterium]MBP3608892.1 hypothetical protein [Lachnospiraceae bacterium]